jgi:hypothetical protein
MRCIKKQKLCGSRSIQAAEAKYKLNVKKRQKARNNERRRIKRRREAQKKLIRRMMEDQKFRAPARQRLKHSRRLAELRCTVYELHIQYRKWLSPLKSGQEQEPEHVESASLTKSEEGREQECHQKRQQEVQQLLATSYELIKAYKELVPACGGTFT